MHHDIFRMENLRASTCLWFASWQHCTSTNCLPKWICDCLRGGVASCWKNCPNWTEWATGSSPFLWVTSPEFRRRACPCEHGQVTSTDSRVFQADRADGQCVQARLPEGTNMIAWDLLYFCLLVALLLVVFCMRKWCGSRKSSRGLD